MEVTVILEKKIYIENHVIFTLIMWHQCEYWVYLFSTNLKRKNTPGSQDNVTQVIFKIKCVFAASLLPNPPTRF